MERALIIGFFLGLALASPLGPMGLVCFRRTLTRGPASGFTSALGISCADFFGHLPQSMDLQLFHNG